MLLISIAWFFDSLKVILIAYLSVFLHELAHYIAAKKLKIEISSMVIMPFGITIRIKNIFIKKPVYEILISVAGPLFSGIIAILACFININFKAIDISFFIYANLAICIVNLLPVLPLDGGRILRATLTNQIGFLRAAKTSIRISRVIIVILALVAIFVLFVSKLNMSVVLIVSFLTFNMTLEHKYNTLIIMRQLANSPQKLKNEGIMPLRHLIALKSVKAKDLTANLSYNHFYIIEVVDEGVHCIGRITESELIEGMVKLGSNADLSQILQLNY